MGEGHGRYLGAWSGYLGILRRKGCGTVGRVSWELERASSTPFLREREADLPITGASGKWWMVERQSEGVILALESFGTTEPGSSEGPLLHRCPRVGRRSLASARKRARSAR